MNDGPTDADLLRSPDDVDARRFRGYPKSLTITIERPVPVAGGDDADVYQEFEVECGIHCGEVDGCHFEYARGKYQEVELTPAEYEHAAYEASDIAADAGCDDGEDDR